MNYLNKKKFNDTIFLFELLGSKHYKEASNHAPALSMALLLFEKNWFDKNVSFSSEIYCLFRSLQIAERNPIT